MHKNTPPAITKHPMPTLIPTAYAFPIEVADALGSVPEKVLVLSPPALCIGVAVVFTLNWTAVTCQAPKTNHLNSDTHCHPQ